MARDSNNLHDDPLDDAVTSSPFIDPWEILRRRWKAVILGLAIGIWCGGVYYLAAPPVYESTAQVLVIQKDPNLPARGTDKEASFESDQFSRLLSTHMQLVVSPRIIRQAIRDKRLDLLPTVDRVRDKDDLEGLQYIIDNMKPVIGDEESPLTEKSKVLKVTFQHSSAEECALVLQAIIESYQRFVEEKFHDVGTEAVHLLTEAQSALSEDLRKEEANYLEFLERAPLLWRGDGGKNLNIYQQRVLALETALSDIRLRHTEAKARLKVIEGALERKGDAQLSENGQLALLNEKEVARLTLLLTATKGDSDNELFQSVQPHRAEAYRARYDQLLTLEAREQSLLVDLGAEHPRVRETREGIRAIRSFLQEHSPRDEHLARRQLQPFELIESYAELLKHDVDDLESRERDLLEHSSRETEAAKSLLIHESQGEALLQEVQRKRQLYEAVVDRLKEVNLIKDFGGITTETIRPVEAGTEPSLYLPIVLAIGAVLGLTCGGATAWVSDVQDRTLRDPADVRRHTGQLPILAHVLRFGTPAGTVSDAARHATTLVAHHLPNSDAAKAFRTLGTALTRTSRDSQLKVLEIASSNSGDGKTTILANLAVAMAQAGKSVLAVDADFRCPALHAMFAHENRAGLSDVIAGAATLEDAIQRRLVPNLDLLSAGSIAQPPANWSASPKFNDLLDAMRSRYDLVLFDTSAALLAADACELAPRADGVMLVISPEATERTQARRTTQALRSAGAKLIGVVVNDVDRFGRYECDDLTEVVGQSNVQRNS
jgi:capsular exopolysaccharide synthesis family protein